VLLRGLIRAEAAGAQYWKTKLTKHGDVPAAKGRAQGLWLADGSRFRLYLGHLDSLTLDSDHHDLVRQKCTIQLSIQRNTCQRDGRADSIVKFPVPLK
jgi:hypothetical protein